MNIKYNGSVLTQAGFRSVEFTAKAEKISEKRCKIIEILEIDGDSVTNNMSRTGSKRQSFYGTWAADRQIGKIKNLSACEVLQS